MARPSYTDEEIRDILQALFQEKKRNKDHEEQITLLRDELVQAREQATTAVSESKEIAQLRQLFQVYKQKYESAVASDQKGEKKGDAQALSEQVDKLKTLLHEQIEENKRLKQGTERLAAIILEKEKRNQELQQYEYSYRRTAGEMHQWGAAKEQHQAAIEKITQEKEQIRKDLEESLQHSRQLERVIHYLRERQEEAQLETAQLEEEFQASHQTIAALTEELKGARKQIEDWEKAHHKESLLKREALEEVVALQSQFETLKRTIANYQQQQADHSHRFDESEKQIQKLKEEIAQYQSTLEQKDAEHQALENELRHIKESLERSLNETKELETRYLETINEKNSQQTKLQTLHQQHQQQHETIDALNQKLQEISSEKRARDSQIEQLNQAQEDANNRFKMSQQHLAKKVKENSELAEKVAHQERLVQEQQTHLNQARLKIAEMQSALDGQLFQEKRLQEQLNEAVKNAETLAAKWEEKYFKISEKWQESELRIKELKKFEEKYNHLQSLLSNLGHMIGTPSIGIVQAAGTSKNEPSLAPTEQEFPKERQKASFEPLDEPPPSQQFQNLFDLPKHSPRPKDNLFEE